MSIRVFEVAPISIDHHLVCLSMSRGHTYIDQPSSYHFHVSSSFRDHTYIDRSFSILVWVFGTAPISIGHSSFYLFVFLVETAPILIGHRFICSSLSQCRTYINQSFSYHFVFNLSRDRTYIDRPSSYHFHVSLSFQNRTYIDWSFFLCQSELGPHPYRSVIFLSFPCQFEFLGPHLYRPIIFSCQSESGSHLYRSVIHPVNSCQFEFLGPHLYRSVIRHVSLNFRVGATPISIGHFPIRLILLWVGTAPILIGHSSY